MKTIIEELEISEGIETFNAVLIKKLKRSWLVKFLSGPFRDKTMPVPMAASYWMATKGKDPKVGTSYPVNIESWWIKKYREGVVESDSGMEGVQLAANLRKKFRNHDFMMTSLTGSRFALVGFTLSRSHREASKMKKGMEKMVGKTGFKIIATDTFTKQLSDRVEDETEVVKMTLVHNHG